MEQLLLITKQKKERKRLKFSVAGQQERKGFGFKVYVNRQGKKVSLLDELSTKGKEEEKVKSTKEGIGFGWVVGTSRK